MKESRYQLEEKILQHNVNYFRESFISNKQIEKENNLLSMRLKEDLTKAKPRLLTGKLPEAFKVRDQSDKREIQMMNKLVSNHLSLFNQKDLAEKTSQNNKKNYQNQNNSEPFSSDNSDSDKTPSAKIKDKEGTYSTRTRTESDETDNDRNMFKRPMFIKGTPFNSCKAQTIDNKAKASQEFCKENAFIKQQRNNTIGNSKTHSLFHKFSIENISSRKNNDKNLNNNVFNKKISLEDGFSYFITSNKYKHYFYVPTMEIYFLKEINYNSKIIESIKIWKHQNDSNVSLLKIFQYFANNPEGCITIIMEHPNGVNLMDIINSTGIADIFLLNKIVRNCLAFLSENSKSNNNQDYGLFCLCDLFYDINGTMKVIPNIFTLYSNDCVMCECKKFINEIAKILRIPITQYLSLGVILLKCAIGNINLKCFDLLFSNKHISIQCCLLHTLFSIEKTMINPKDTLLLSNFLRLLPENFIQLLCQLLSIDASKQSLCLGNPWLKQIAIRPNVSLHMKELLKIINQSFSIEPHLHKFITSFDIVFSQLKEGKDNKGFLSNFKSKINVINAICQIFDVEPDYLMSKLHVNNKEV